MNERAILSLAKEFETLARALGAGDQGHLRVGMAGGVSLLPLMPAAISAFRREKLGVTVTLEKSNTPALCASLRLGQVDMAIIPAYLQQIHTQGVTFHPILGEMPRATIAMATTHAAPNKAATAFVNILKKLCASSDGKTVGTC
ncbi:MAG: LysR substrate-binding domain-containing protein [Acetobacteraceae bacterium]